MKTSTVVRTVATVLVSLIAYVVNSLYVAAMPSIEASVAVGQVQDSIMTYSLSQAFMRSHVGGYIILGVYLLALLVIWWGALKPSRKNDQEEI